MSASILYVGTENRNNIDPWKKIEHEIRDIIDSERNGAIVVHSQEQVEVFKIRLGSDATVILQKTSSTLETQALNL